MTGNSIITLADGALYALQNTYELNGWISSHPRSARGYTTSSCYLLKQDDGAVLLDTGYMALSCAV